MPLVYQQNINQTTRLAVWHIAEGEDFFLPVVPLHKEITHPHKRLQHLAGRYLLKELYPDFPLNLVLIADTRKPFLEDEQYHFSISHCGDYAAAIVSSTQRVGVDIEQISPKVFSIRHKFLSVEECDLIDSTPHSPGMQLKACTFAWSIKEAMFKWYGLGGIDFKKHLQIVHWDFDENECHAKCLFGKGEERELYVSGLSFNNNVLTWTVT